MRLREGAPAREATRQAMSALQIPGSGDAPATVEREVLGALLDVNAAELAYEDGITLDQATRDIRDRLFPAQSVAQIAARPPALQSARAGDGATVELHHHLGHDRAEHVRKVVEIRDDIVAAGRPASAREIQRRLSKRMREGLPTERIAAITQCLDRIDLGEDFLPTPEQRKAKSAEIVSRFDDFENRLRRNERKRNERQLRELRRSYLSAADTESTDTDPGLFEEVGSGADVPSSSDADWVDEMLGDVRPGGDHPSTATVLPFPLGKAATG